MQGGNGYFRGRNTLDAEGTVGDTPFLNHAADGVIGDEASVCGEREGLVGEGASEVTIFEPGLDASTIVGDAGGKSDGVVH